MSQESIPEYAQVINSFIKFLGENGSPEDILDSVKPFFPDENMRDTIPAVIEDGHRHFFSTQKSAYILKTDYGYQLHFDAEVELIPTTNEFVQFLSKNPSLVVRGFTSTVSVPALDILYREINNPNQFKTIFLPFKKINRQPQNPSISVANIHEIDVTHNEAEKIILMSLPEELPNGERQIYLTYNDVVGELVRAIYPNYDDLKKSLKALSRMSLTFQWFEHPEL